MESETETQETEKSSKKKKKDTDSESETERSDRENTGDKLKKKALLDKLSDVLSYLFVAEKVEIPDEVKELLAETLPEDGTAEDLILQDEEGAALLSSLEGESLELANARSSKKVTVLNVYADENGTLDESQLEALSSDKTLDATDTLYVINVIADSAEQALTVSGYTIMKSGAVVTYADAAEAGDVVYNFAALDGDSYVGYTGELTLAAGMQGTVLAPEASVTVQGDFSGAVYAKTVTVVSETAQLLRIVFSKGMPEETETEAETEAETKTVAEAESATEAGTIAETETEIETESEVASETGEEADSETETETETDTEAETETETEMETETETEMETETGTETETEAETETAAEAETETDTETETESETEIELATETAVTSVGRSDSKASTDTKMMTAAELEDGTEAMAAESDDGTEATAAESEDGTEATAAESGDGTEATTGELETETETEAADKSITVSAQTVYSADASTSGSKVTLAAETEVTYCAALFAVMESETETESSTETTASAAVIAESDSQETATSTAVINGTTMTRVSEVKKLIYTSGSTVSQTVTFDALTSGTYYVVATASDGTPLSSSDVLNAPVAAVTLSDDSETTKAQTAVLEYVYSGAWTEGTFGYTVDLAITLNVLDRSGKALTGSEIFYANIYSDSAKTTAVTDEPVSFAMDGASTLTQTVTLTATAAQQTFYIVETDSSGSAVTGGENGFAYNISYSESDAIAVACGDTSKTVTIQNKLNDTTVKIRVVSASDGSLLSGAKLALKDSSGSIYEVSAAGGKTFTSGSSDIVWTNELTDGETYYLTEITAPSGYTPVPDVKFTVTRGCTTEVVLTNTATATTSYALTVTKQVYVGDYQVYAYDTTTGSYSAKGAYTYYIALFSDSARTKKVSDVVSLNVSGFSGSVTFSNLTKDGVYYVSETDEYGIAKSSTSSLTIRYTNSGKVTMSQTARSMAVQNVYSSLPGGYRYTGVLSLTLNVTDSSGTAEAVTNTFYLGIYRSSDYSDSPTIVKMSLSNASTVTVNRRILLSGENSMTYYIAEVDSSGNRITDSSDFTYVVSVDNPTVTISKGTTQTVTVTNKLKATKVTLYLTKRVYDGTEAKAVSETFYAGLFKDEDLTELYADPIALQLENASEKTLKLTLNLGTASGVTIYIAEVDKDGNVITNQRSFGYQIRIINATAAFTQDNLAIQTVLMNSVYGSTTEDDWESILNATSSSLLGDSSYYSMDDNGYVSGELANVQTGDDTPLFEYVILMGAALAVLGWEIRRRRLKTKS